MENLGKSRPRFGYPERDIMEFLQSKGIDAKKEKVSRNVAGKNGLKAYELVE